MRMTLNIDDALVGELRVRAQETGRPMSATIEEILRRGLAAKNPSRKAVQAKTFKVGIKTPYLRMSMNQLYDQLETRAALKPTARQGSRRSTSNLH